MTTTEALNKIASEEGFRDFTALMENASLAYIADRCQKAMKLYAATIRDEDRKLITKHVKMTGIAYGNDTSITDYEVDLDSILNASKQELK